MIEALTEFAEKVAETAKEGSEKVKGFADSNRPIEKNVEQPSLKDDRQPESSRFSDSERPVDSRGVEQPKLLSKENMEDYQLNSTYKERLDRVPKNPENGIWSGEIGESKYVPKSEEAQAELKSKNLDGINYKNAQADFHPISHRTVEIEHMGSQRYGKSGNFEQCDQKLADQWNTDNKDNRNDWTSRDAANYRTENKLTWHECNDMKTCELVPQSVHKVCTHLGGVSECRKKEEIQTGGIFDE